MRIGRTILIAIGCLVAAALLFCLGSIAYFLAGRAADRWRQARRVEALRAVPVRSTQAADLVAGADVRMNEIQMVATHNSYHLRADPLRMFFVGLVEPGWPAKLDYSHAPLYDQFDAGVRSVELDVRSRRSRFVISHVPLVDDRTPCPDFALALQEIRIWSERHPGHLPIIVIMELKNDWSFLIPGQRDFDRAALDRLNAEVRSAFPASGILTPDDVRQGAATLEEAVLTRGWPRLADVAGRVMFVIHENETYRRLFTAGNPTLAGRALFTCAAAGNPDAAIRILNDPIGDGPQIRALVQRGYLVRTRADADLAIDQRVVDAALASGVQIVSTDFPPSEPDRRTGYFCAFPGGATARVRPGG